MIEVECPHCGAVIVTDDSLAGEIVSCQHCSRPFELPEHSAASNVIEVRTEEVGPGFDSGHSAVPSGPIEPPRPGPAEHDEPPRTVYAFDFERRYGGDSGCCCGAGCLVLFLLTWLLLKGLFALF